MEICLSREAQLRRISTCSVLRLISLQLQTGHENSSAACIIASFFHMCGMLPVQVLPVRPGADIGKARQGKRAANMSSCDRPG